MSNNRLGVKGWSRKRKYVFKKAIILFKLSGVDYRKKIRASKETILKEFNVDLDDKINKILNYEEFGDDPVVQAALAKHGVLSIAKLSKQ
jgi:hypothetical protein